MTQWLVGALLATSGLMAFVLLARGSVRRYFGANVAYSLWLIPAARMLMPTISRTVERPATVETSAIIATTTHAHSRFALLGSWQTFVIALWITGAFAMFLVRMVQFTRQRSAILRTSRQIDKIGSIRILATTQVGGPISFGLFDRVIALPADYETRFNEAERALALKHELAHHRSGDLIANFAAFILLCLQWFNPLAWAAHAAFRFDQEAACDARVLSHATDHRADYGRAIAKAASGRGLLFAGALDRHSSLQRRLECMLSPPPAAHRLAGRLVVVTTLAAALPLTATRAVNYVDAPTVKAFGEAHRLNTQMSRAPMGESMPLETVVKHPMQAEQVNFAQGKVPEVVQPGVEPGEVQNETLEVIQARRDQEQARRDVEQAQRDQERRRRDLEQAQTDEQEARLDANRTLEETAPGPNSEPNSVEYIGE